MANEDRSLIPSRDVSLATTTEGAKRIMSAMVAETLALTQREQARWKIGGYEWCEPDYQQILLWAKQLALNPEKVIQHLLDMRSLTDEFSGDVWEPTAFQDGRIVKLNWDLELLPLSDFEWVEGLEIEYLRFAWQARESDEEPSFDAFSPRLSKLLRLDVSGCYNLPDLCLAGTPKLEELVCGANQLKHLTLNDTPHLRKLDCHRNELTELDLSGVPHLAQLNCSDNPLSVLDLKPVPRLIQLSCRNNGLAALDLSCVGQLTELNCIDNELTSLNLFDVPNLVELKCSKNRVTRLDLKALPHLTHLECIDNRLTELNLADVPELQILRFHTNNLTELDLTGVPRLQSLEPERRD